MPAKPAFSEPVLELEIGGKAYKFSAWGPRDFAAARQHITSQKIQALFATADAMTGPDRAAFLAERPQAIAGVASKWVPQEEVAEFMGSPEGMAFMVQRSLLPFHPDVSIDDAMRLASRMADVLPAIMAHSGMGAEEGEPGRPTTETPSNGSTTSPASPDSGASTQ